MTLQEFFQTLSQRVSVELSSVLLLGVYLLLRFLGRVKVLHLKIGNAVLEVEVEIGNSNQNKSGNKDTKEKDLTKSIKGNQKKDSITPKKDSLTEF